MKRLLFVTLASVLLAGLVAASVPDARALAHSHAQSMGNVDLLAGEDVTVTCAGDQIVIRPIDNVSVRLDCKGSGNPPPTATTVANIPPTDVPPTMVMPTDTPVPDATLTPTLQATATPVANTPAPTITPPQLPSATPVANTPVPAPTNTPDPHVSIQPYAGAPLCASHDDNAWHGLWDYQNGCHFNHTHNADPATGDAVFGKVGALWGGQEISYPWLTSALENTMKHGGYKYAVRLNMPCGATADLEGRSPVHCITDARVEYHAVSGLMDYLARFHSFYAEYRVCARPNYTQCGIVRTGGWADFGILEAPYKVNHVVRPGGTIDFGNGMVMNFTADAPELANQSVHDEPYLAVESSANLNFFRNNQPPGGGVEVWSMDDFSGRYGHNPYLRFAFRIFDMAQLVDVSNPNRIVTVCNPINSCAWNGSLHAFNEMEVNIPSAWDADKDGFADYNGYTDRHGKIVTGCTAPGLDCVPIQVTHVPVGLGFHADPGNGISEAQEFDLSPAGARWIQFPN